LSSHVEHFSKSLFNLSRCRIAEDDGSIDVLSRSQVHANDRDEVDLAAQQVEEAKKTRCIHEVGLFCMLVIRIYREKLTRVKVYDNPLGFHIKSILDT
jgi:hypothetical protein